MNRDATNLFLALLTVLANAFVFVAFVGWLIARLRPSSAVAARIEGARYALAREALWLAAVVAIVTMLGSLYLSEIADYPPCKLCWFQRIAMYPLSVILVVAVIFRDRGVRRYVWPLALVGSAISIYHYQLERFPQQHSLTCSLELPCTTVWIWKFHYISIPFMALSSFVAIAVLVHLAATSITDDEATVDEASRSPEGAH